MTQLLFERNEGQTASEVKYSLADHPTSVSHRTQASCRPGGRVGNDSPGQSTRRYSRRSNCRRRQLFIGDPSVAPSDFPYARYDTNVLPGIDGVLRRTGSLNTFRGCARRGPGGDPGCFQATKRPHRQQENWCFIAHGGSATSTVSTRKGRPPVLGHYLPHSGW